MRKIRTSLTFPNKTAQSFSNYSGKKNILTPAFSLMEMMVVLLIVAIIAAASAPMITKKMAKGAVNGDSPWVFTSVRGDLAYNTNGGDRSVIIGASKYDNDNGAGPKYPRLVLATGDENHSGFVFADSDGKFLSMLSQSGSITAWNTRADGKEATPGANSVAIGTNQTIDKVNNSNSSPATGVVALGDGVHSGGNNSITIGYQANTSHDPTITDMSGSNNSNQSIAIGERARACKYGAIAIGPYYNSQSRSTQAARGGSVAIGLGTEANGHSSIAIGEKATASVGSATTEGGSIAIGESASATQHRSVAIGAGAIANKKHQITLGTADDTVYIPGRLVVDRGCILGRTDPPVFMRLYDRVDDGGWEEQSGTSAQRLIFPRADNVGDNDNGRDPLEIGIYRKDTQKAADDYETIFSSYPKKKSDRRLKNVGEKYTAGLAELKKLDFFHYTFKKDEAKRPHVGVIAQDLEQVFPDSVTKGEDGYLRIRWDEMFYAVINAVKELDSRIITITENVKANFDKIAKLEETISEQQKTIEELKAQNEEFKAQNEIYEKQFELMEKRLSKVERGKYKNR